MKTENEKYFCLNCGAEIKFDEENAIYITTCETCNWRNELDTDPCIEPITLKSKMLPDFSTQICYPLIEKKDLEYLPEKLKKSVETFFRNPEKLTKEQYDNIYHNLYRGNLKIFERISKRYRNKLKLSLFFKNTNFLKSVRKQEK